MAVELTLLSRSYCHLCHDMEVALEPLAAEFGVTVKVVDVDSDPLLEATYDELVPVLLHGETNSAITSWTSLKSVNIWPESVRIQGLLNREGRRTSALFY